MQCFRSFTEDANHPTPTHPTHDSVQCSSLTHPAQYVDPIGNKFSTCYPAIFNRQEQPKSPGSLQNSNAYDSKRFQGKMMMLNTSQNHETSVVVGKRQGEVHAKEEVLLTIPGAVVHLIDGQESVHLATGHFSLIRLNQDGNGIAVFAKVGEELQWPLATDAPITKLDKRHYFFTLKVPQGLDDEQETSGDSETLSYGVTFAAESDDSRFKQLDKFLREYSYFSAPSVVRGPSYRKGEVDQRIAAAEQKAKADEGSKKQKFGLDYITDCILGQHNPPAKPTSLPDSTIPVKFGASGVTGDKKQLVEEASAAYWTTVAPNVESYNSSLAKGVAAGSGQIIRGIFWCSDTTVSQLEKGGLYLRERMKPNDKPTQISPRTMRNIKRVRKMSKMTEKVTIAVLQGIITTTGIVTGTIIKSKAGQKFFKMLPGEVALASLDAFAKVFDAVEMAGKHLLTSTNEVTSGLVSHRYGEEAAAAAKEGLATAGHLANTAWTVSKIRNALNPKEGVKNSKSELVKTAGKAVLTAAASKKH